MFVELDKIIYKRASLSNTKKILEIITRCMKEVNYIDYPQEQFNKFLNSFTKEWLSDIIENRHYYEVWYDNEIIAVGGVSRDKNQKKQSYYTAIFVNPDLRGLGIGRALIMYLETDEWCLDSEIIEVPSSISQGLHALRFAFGSNSV